METITWQCERPNRRGSSCKAQASGVRQRSLSIDRLDCGSRRSAFPPISPMEDNPVYRPQRAGFALPHGINGTDSARNSRVRSYAVARHRQSCTPGVGLAESRQQALRRSLNPANRKATAPSSAKSSPSIEGSGVTAGVTPAPKSRVYTGFGDRIICGSRSADA